MRKAQAELMSKFKLSERQSQAIMICCLRRLTGLERDISLVWWLIALIADLADILAKPERVAQIIKGGRSQTQFVDNVVPGVDDRTNSWRWRFDETDMLEFTYLTGAISNVWTKGEFTAQKRGGQVEFKVRRLRMMTLREVGFNRHPWSSALLYR